MPVVFPLGEELNDDLAVIQLRAQWTLGHQGRGESSWSFIMRRFAPVDQLQIVYDLWVANCAAHYVFRRPTVWRFNRIIVQDRFPAVRPDLYVPIETDGPGPGADSIPVQFGPLISWRSTLPGRSYRGRTFWGPIMRDDLDSDFIANIQLNNLEDFGDAMMATFGHILPTQVDPAFAIVSRRHNNAPEPVGRFALVDHYYPIRIMATQRRRQQWYDL